MESLISSQKQENIWILGIYIKEPTSSRQVQEAISSQQLTGKLNRLHSITARRDKYIIRTNIQENICIFNQIRHIQAIGEKLVSIPTEPPTPNHI